MEDNKEIENKVHLLVKRNSNKTDPEFKRYLINLGYYGGIGSLIGLLSGNRGGVLIGFALAAGYFHQDLRRVIFNKPSNKE